MHKPTVTIAVSVYNEEENIQSFLKSIIAQKEEGYVLEKILIISDGSSDRTIEIARKFRSPKLHIKDYKTRTGKSTRLNEIYSSLRSELLVQFDADVQLAHPLVVHDIIQPLIKEKNVAMCGGHPQPIPGVTFTEKAVNCTFDAYAPLRKTYRGGNNVFSVDGRILSYKKELLKKIIVPADMTANDAFTYFACLTNGYQYRHVSTAVVLFRSPQTVKDQIKQNTRFLAMPSRMSLYYSEEIVKKERSLPLWLQAKIMFLQFYKHPIMCSYIFAINIYCRLKVKSYNKYISAKWQMAQSTKNLEPAKLC